MTKKEAADMLENMVDLFGLSTIVDMLANVATEKSEHLATNWQDEGGAEAWQRRAMVLDVATSKLLDIA
jgi:hypothetical protein